MNDILKIHQTTAVATITLNRPEFGNALNHELISALTTTLQKLDDEKDVRVICITGAGKHFCTGGDIAAMQKSGASSYKDNVADAKHLAYLMQTLQSVLKPTIAMVHGAAFGGAIGLISCCDIAIAADDAKFCLPEARVGIVPAVIFPYVISAIGERQAKYHFLNNAVFTAQRALQIGLIHQMSQKQNLIEECDIVIKQLLQNSPHAMKTLKKLFMPLTDAQIEFYAKQLADIRASQEGQEGLQAFLQKRKPHWILLQGDEHDV